MFDAVLHRAAEALAPLPRCRARLVLQSARRHNPDDLSPRGALEALYRLKLLSYPRWSVLSLSNRICHCTVGSPAVVATTL